LKKKLRARYTYKTEILIRKVLTFVAFARFNSMPSGEVGEHPDKVSFIFLTSFHVGSFSFSMPAK